MSYTDLITTASRTPQVITTDAVSEHVNEAPNDTARGIFIHSNNIIRVQVAVAAAGMASGIRFEYRFDTEAGLASGSQIVVADSGIILPAALTLGVVIEFRCRPMYIASGYDFQGGFYNLVSEAASGGTAFIMDIRGGADADRT
jgi:hypothetical protein